jgi:DNA-binding response OmpR family regulator
MTEVTQTARVLLADDDGEFRTALAELLREDGNEVAEAVDGAALLECLARAELGASGYDLVITDFRMPGYDAFDVMLRVRPELTTTPFILLTAFGDANTDLLARRLGAVAVLHKPVDFAEVRAVISDVLSRRSGS